MVHWSICKESQLQVLRNSLFVAWNIKNLLQFFNRNKIGKRSRTGMGLGTAPSSVWVHDLSRTVQKIVQDQFQDSYGVGYQFQQWGGFGISAMTSASSEAISASLWDQDPFQNRHEFGISYRACMGYGSGLRPKRGQNLYQDWYAFKINS